MDRAPDLVLAEKLLGALLGRGLVDVKPLTTHHFPLDRFAEAWETFLERRDGAIRVMLHPERSS